MIEVRDINQLIETHLLPFGARILASKALSAMKDGLGKLTPVLVIYSLFVALGVLIADTIPFYQQANLIIIAGINVAVLVSVIYYYSQSLQLESVTIMILGSMSYLMLAFPNYQLNQLVIAAIMAILFVRIFQLFQKCSHFFEEKMPTEKIPPGVYATAFDLVPIFLFAAVIMLIRIGIAQLSWETIMLAIQGVLFTIGDSLVSIFLLELFGQVLWYFGMHGNTVISMIADPIWMGLSLDNLAAFGQGLEGVHIVTKQFKETFMQIGGSGSTLPLVLLLLCSKSKRLRTFALMVLPASLFNINEPVIFGLPIVLTPTLLVPWLITTPILSVITFSSMKLGLVAVTSGVFIPWITPVLLSGFLVSGISGTVLQVILMGVVMVIYLPFIKRFERLELAKEQA